MASTLKSFNAKNQLFKIVLIFLKSILEKYVCHECQKTGSTSRKRKSWEEFGIVGSKTFFQK